MKILTVIPARSGSKSVKDKNIKLLKGRPLLDFSIKYSLKCSLITDTIVSTDSKEYSEIAISLGEKCPFLRPDYLAGDLVKDFEVINHALLKMEEINSHLYDLIVLLRPTSPLRPEGLIEKSIEMLLNNKSSTSVRAMTKSSQHPFRSWKLSKDGSVESFFDHHEPYNFPRQELPVSYFQTGDIEVIKRETMIKGSISGNEVLPILIDNNDYIDIDEINDFIKAKRLLDEKQ